MRELRYTLLSDGSSDRALIPILTWLLRQHVPDTALQSEWADLRRLPEPPRKLAERIRACIDLYPCDLLFIHRDAEGESHGSRISEIQAAIAETVPQTQIPYVCVVPVRMTEAWLLLDCTAIRRSAGNPAGNMDLELPPLRTVEDIPDPKTLLYDLLRTASGLHGRRRKQFRPQEAARRIPNFIGDFSPLRGLPAFQQLESDLKRFALRLA